MTAATQVAVPPRFCNHFGASESEHVEQRGAPQYDQRERRVEAGIAREMQPAIARDVAEHPGPEQQHRREEDQVRHPVRPARDEPVRVAERRLGPQVQPAFAGKRELSSSTDMPSGMKNASRPRTQSARLDGPICAAVDSQRRPTIAEMLSSTTSRSPRTRCRCTPPGCDIPVTRLPSAGPCRRAKLAEIDARGSGFEYDHELSTVRASGRARRRRARNVPDRARRNRAT